MDTAGPPPTHRVTEVFFKYTCNRDPQPILLFSDLMRCRRVCRDWRHALDEAFPMSKHISFRPFQARVTGGDVLGWLERLVPPRVPATAAATLIDGNLKTVDLQACKRIDGAEMEAILSRIEQTFAVTGIDVQGCGASAVLRAVAVRAQTCFHVDSPADLFAVLSVDGKCSFVQLLQRLREGPAPHLEFDQQFNPEEKALLTEAQHGSTWTVALLLCTCFDAVDGGQGRTFDCDVRGRDGNRAVHYAARRGDQAMMSVLMSARANINVRNEEGETPLLAACRAGHFDLAKLLVEKGADVRAAQHDGATPLAVSILSGRTDLMHLVTKTIAGYPSDPRDGSFMQNLAQAYLDWRKLEAWLRGGTSPLSLKGHIGALLSLSSIDPATKEQLGHVRAFLNHNEALLEKSPSEWPATHTVLQLASQETGEVFADPHSALVDETSPAKRPPRLIHWLNKPNSHRCRLTMRARAAVRSVSYSKCGRKLARAEGNAVVVCDAETGFVESTLTGHRYVPSL